MTKPSYDELEQALIVADTTIATLREQLKGVQKVRDEYHQQWMDASDAEEALKQQLATVTEERDAYRHGGVTEEILRRQDGYLKIGRGCCVVLESDWQAKKEAQP